MVGTARTKWRRSGSVDFDLPVRIRRAVFFLQTSRVLVSEPVQTEGGLGLPWAAPPSCRMIIAAGGQVVALLIPFSGPAAASHLLGKFLYRSFAPAAGTPYGSGIIAVGGQFVPVSTYAHRS